MSDVGGIQSAERSNPLTGLSKGSSGNNPILFGNENPDEFINTQKPIDASTAKTGNFIFGGLLEIPLMLLGLFLFRHKIKGVLGKIKGIFKRGADGAAQTAAAQGTKEAVKTGVQQVPIVKIPVT